MCILLLGFLSVAFLGTLDYLTGYESGSSGLRAVAAERMQI